MHELALMEDLVDTVSSGITHERVHVVRLVVGLLSGASPHALRFSFDVCTRGTALEGAALEILETSGNELRLAEVEVT
jgi:hydrogenase nickel incorporation protein HypA/HybF